MTLTAEFDDPRLLTVYDAENGWGPDDTWFLDRVGALRADAVADLGCGTGRLTVRLPSVASRVVGVDPSARAIARARRRPGAGSVTWRVGDAHRLDEGAFDVVLLTSHVTQFLVLDTDWFRTLVAVRRALRPGGHVLLDSRNPAGRAWERWDGAVREVVVGPGDDCVVTTRVLAVRGGTDPVVDFERHYRFTDGHRARSSGSLTFRRLSMLESDLSRQGLELSAAYGGWAQEPPADDHAELVLVATRPG